MARHFLSVKQMVRSSIATHQQFSSSRLVTGNNNAAEPIRGNFRRTKFPGRRVGKMAWRFAARQSKIDDMTQLRLPGFIDSPTFYDTRAAWERHLKTPERLPANMLLHEEMLQKARLRMRKSVCFVLRFFGFLSGAGDMLDQIFTERQIQPA